MDNALSIERLALILEYISFWLIAPELLGEKRLLAAKRFVEKTYHALVAFVFPSIVIITISGIFILFLIGMLFPFIGMVTGNSLEDPFSALLQKIKLPNSRDTVYIIILWVVANVIIFYMNRRSDTKSALKEYINSLTIVWMVGSLALLHYYNEDNVDIASYFLMMLITIFALSLFYLYIYSLSIIEHMTYILANNEFIRHRSMILGGIIFTLSFLIKFFLTIQ